MDFAQIFFHSCSLFFSPIFEFMKVKHEQNILATALEALWESACYLLSVSTLDAAIIVFYMEKKSFALNSLLEENGFTFLECVRTP